MKSTFAQRVVAEALGTAFLLAAVVGSGIMAAKLSGGNAALALLCNTLPTGAILVVLILMLERIPVMFECNRRGARNSCILGGRAIIR